MELSIKDINATINCYPVLNGAGEMVDIRCEWDGGDIIGITSDLLEDADPRWLKREDDEIQIGQYRVKVMETIVYGQRKGRDVTTVICQRINDQ